MSKIKTISIDIETFSDVDLQKCGVYKYVQSPVFEVLLFGYSVNGAAVQVVDLAQGESIPDEILKALTDDTVLKWAFNAQFERVCLSAYLKKHYPQYFAVTVFRRTVSEITLPRLHGDAPVYGLLIWDCHFLLQEPVRFLDWKNRN